MKVLHREDLVRHLDALVAPKGDEPIIWQCSSGTTGSVLRVPRTHADLADTVRRVARPYVERFGALPARAALLGGISHEEVAASWRAGELTIASFSLDDLDALEAFTPELVSCYPSLMRKLVDDPRLSFGALRALKLGGERVHPADVERLAQRFPGVPVIEQYGSTELPALALRVHQDGVFTEPFALEEGRFDFRLGAEDGWHDLIARDRFDGAPAPFRAFYDTGDEARLRNGRVVEFRRRHDPANPWFGLAGDLLRRGVRQVQLDLERARIVYTGEARLPDTLEAGGRCWETHHRAHLPRDASNKLPLVFRGSDGA